MTVFILPIFFFTADLIRLFDPSGHPKIMEGSLSFFKVTLWSLPITAMGIVLSGTLRGAGDTKPAMYSSILNRSLVQLGLGWWLAFPMEMGFIGVWYGVIAGRIIDSIFLMVIWLRKKWIWVALKKTAVYRTHLIHLAQANLKRYLKEIRSPLMAENGTKELLEMGQVVYQRDGKRTVVRFEGDGYSRESS